MDKHLQISSLYKIPVKSGISEEAFVTNFFFGKDLMGQLKHLSRPNSEKWCGGMILYMSEIEVTTAQ